MSTGGIALVEMADALASIGATERSFVDRVLAGRKLVHATFEITVCDFKRANY
jgi:hypothetical protein